MVVGEGKLPPRRILVVPPLLTWAVRDRRGGEGVLGGGPGRWLGLLARVGSAQPTNSR